jgi:P4 family phage/plasmid primase-like protien
MLMLTGDGGNGKSCVLAGITGMLGADNVSNLSLDELAEKFKLPRILGKLANICADMPDTSRTCEGTLKKLISGDPMEFEAKYQHSFSAVSTAKLIFSTNTLPQFCDRSSGLWRRLIIIPFNRTVTAEEKVRGMDTPAWWVQKGEMPGIFIWALRGLQRLLRNRLFTESEVCNAAITAHRQECNTALSWLNNEYELHESGEVEKEGMYSRYVEHCRQSGLKPLSNVQFFKEVRKAFGTLDERRDRRNLKRVRVLIGIRPIA